MKKKLFFSLVVLVLVVLPLFSACPKPTLTPTATPTATPASTPTPTKANWWDKFGEPQYGGTLSVRLANTGFETWDPAEFGGYGWGYWECLFARDWVVDRQTCDFTTEMVPVEYYKSGLAESWERPDPLTVTVHLRQGVHWQDKPPLNGRELTADDVVYTYDRILGTGSGFTEPNPILAGSIPNVERVVKVDKYTVQFKLKNPAAIAIYDVFDGGFFAIVIEAPELVQQGTLKDWKTAVGTGPWMLTDFVSSSSVTYTRNPNYWGYDERHPQNRLPYIDTVKEVVISDIPTAVAALRTGKIDILEGMNVLTWQQAQSIANTNPEIQQSTWPTPGQTLEMRVDLEPFTDIRVRKALQLALDLKTIAQTHYGGMVSGAPEGLISSRFKGWTLPYDQWPAELQEEYSYNPTKAKELLAEAGHPNGFKTDIIAQPAGEDIELLEIIKAYFMDIGVDMEIKMFPDMAAKQSFAMAGKMDAMTYTNTAGHPRAPFVIIPFRTPDNRENYTHSNDPQYNALVEQALTATTIDEVQQLCAECDQYALKQHWAVQVFGTVSPICWQPWVKGNSGEQLVSGAYFYYSRWWIDEALKK